MGKRSLFVLTLLQFSHVMLEDINQRAVNGDIVTKDFDVGFVSGSSVVRIRNRKNLLDVWSELRKPGNKITLWCDGLVDRSGNTVVSRMFAPLFCNLSISRKCRGGIYAGSDILSHEYASSSGATPRC